VQRVGDELALARGPVLLHVREVALEHVLGHRPREAVVLGARELDRPVDEHEPADVAAAARHVLERDRAAHRPAHERDVLEPQLAQHELEVVGHLVEVVAAVRLVRLAHAAQVEGDDAVRPREAHDRVLERPVRELPAVDEHDRALARAAIGDAQADPVGCGEEAHGAVQ
jgi:hypothetical protein